MAKDIISPPPETTPITNYLYLYKEPTTEGWIGAISLEQSSLPTSSFKTVNVSFSLMGYAANVQKDIRFTINKLIDMSVSVQAVHVMLRTDQGSLQNIPSTNVKLTDAGDDVTLVINAVNAKIGYMCFGQIDLKLNC